MMGQQKLRWLTFLLVCTLFMVIGCATPPVETGPVVEANVLEHTVSADLEPASAVVDDASPSDWLTVSGRTADGLAMLGNPDAPVTMIDYADFM